jgi:hypothetical protein
MAAEGQIRGTTPELAKKRNRPRSSRLKQFFGLQKSDLSVHCVLVIFSHSLRPNQRVEVA